jgi:hypothetical protein
MYEPPVLEIQDASILREPRSIVLQDEIDTLREYWLHVAANIEHDDFIYTSPAMVPVTSMSVRFTSVDLAPSQYDFGDDDA